MKITFADDEQEYLDKTAMAKAAEKYSGPAQISNSDTEFFVDVVLKI